MIPVIDINTFSLPSWISLSGSFLMATFITWISIPTIVKISKFKKLHAHLNERASHNGDTPNLGGLAVFAGFTLSIVSFSLRSDSGIIRYLLGSSIILYLIGIKDDILIIDPKKKLLGQLFAALLIVWLGELRITDFHQALGIGEVHPFISIIFTVLLIILVINGFNFIDGIDGLASGMGILISLFYGIWFILTKHITSGVFSLSLAGSLIAFFRYNVFSLNNRVFLGDTGSMLIGLVISVLTIQFLEFELDAPSGFKIGSAPAISFGLLIIPLTDMLKVFIIRLWNGKSPLKADRTHIHHALISIGYSHLATTIILLTVTLLFLLPAVLLRNLGVIKLLMLMIFFAFIVLSIPWFILRIRNKSGPN
jgi:UDP-GlcNAc:undecaprenyl-phosphate GlcNAc-1-phosphate transferase